jgi:hypothetical protein
VPPATKATRSFSSLDIGEVIADYTFTKAGL